MAIDRDYFAGGLSHYDAAGNIQAIRLPAVKQTIGTAPLAGEQAYHFQVWRGTSLVREATQLAAAYASVAHRGAELTLTPPLPATDGGMRCEYSWRLSIDEGAWAGPFPVTVNQIPSAPYDLAAGAEE